MDCFHDFCLACDRESPDGPYCSQSCRLADLEKARISINLAPTATYSSSQQESRLGHGSRYVLAPAYKFPVRTPFATQPSASLDTRSAPTQTLQDLQRQSQQQSLDQRSLTSCSSRSSLSSNRSSSSPNSISERAMQELQEYFRSFDQARSSRRRQSLM